MVLKVISHMAPLTPHPYRGDAVDCPVCDSRNHTRISKWDRSLKTLHTDLCNECGLFFTNPMPNDEELNAFYKSVYRPAYQFAFVGPRKTHKRKKLREAVRRADIIADVLGADRCGRSLDFGCGSGELVRELASRGFDARGFEPGAQFGAHAGSSAVNGAVLIGPWKQMQFPEGAFDLITCLHVLEHLNEPIAALERLHHWLAPDGVLYLETPNMQAPALKGFDCFHFAHVLGFSRDNIIFAAQRAGFAVLQENSPTSFFLVKSHDNRAATPSIDLKSTAEKNRAEYSEPITLRRYLRRHAGRLRKTARDELNHGRAPSRTTDNDGSK